MYVLRHPLSNYESLLEAKQKSDKKYWGLKFPGWGEYRDVDLQLQVGIHLKAMLDIIAEDVKDCGILNHRYLRIKYERLVSDPLVTISQVLNFSDLRITPGIERAIGRVARD